MRRLSLPFLIFVFLCSPLPSFAGLNSDFLGAVSGGNLSRARELILKGADINAVDKAGDTALMEIASNGHADMPQLWNDAEFIQPAFRFPKFGEIKAWRPPFLIPNNKEMRIARFLTRRGANLNAKNSYGRTALMLAAKYGQAGLVRLFITHGADVNMADENGRTALDYAYQTEHQQVAALIEYYRLHPLSERDQKDVERLSRQNLSREEIARIASRVAKEAQNSTQTGIARRLDILAKEIESLKKRSHIAKKMKMIKSDVDAPHFQEPLRQEDFAVVVGVEKYAGRVARSEFSQRDALTVKKYMLALGVPSGHIRFLLNETATKSDLSAYLEDWLPKNVKKDSRVFFYFSGHGAPNPESGEAYLVPFDGDPEFLGKTAYSLKKLYADILNIPARREIVVLDSCFSGMGARSIIRPGLRPLMTRIKPGFVPGNGKIVVLTAARDDQTAGVIKRQGHGLLTYYFSRGLNGKALNRQKRVTLKSLYDYLAPEVQSQADLKNHSQNPQLLPRTALAKIFPVILR